VEGRALNPRNAGREFVAPTSKPAEKQGVRVLPPRYVALSKSQKEAAVAALTELILANMRRLEKVRPAGRKMSPPESSSRTSIDVPHRRAEHEGRHVYENLDRRGAPAFLP
jgi:hypothetical protein